MSALSVLPAYSHCNLRNLCVVRTLSVVSTRSPCCLRGWTSVLSNVIRTLSATSVLSPYCIRRYPLLSGGNLGQFVHPLLHPYWLRTLSVLSPKISANLNKIPYCLRTLYAKFRPYSVRSDPQHPCVGVKGALNSSTFHRGGEQKSAAPTRAKFGTTSYLGNQ